MHGNHSCIFLDIKETFTVICLGSFQRSVSTKYMEFSIKVSHISGNDIPPLIESPPIEMSGIRGRDIRGSALENPKEFLSPPN